MKQSTFRAGLAVAGAFIAAVLAASPATTSKASKSVIPFIEDDYPKALAEARAKKLPIFAEVWAPWCHTCRSMQAFVFTDKALAPSVPQFVWLSIDTERTQNAAFAKKYPIRAWPSFYVIDPDTETVTLRWVGGATVGQLQKLFGQVKRGGGDGSALARADALYGAGDYPKAAEAYAAAMATLPAGSPEYARAVEARLYCLMVGRREAECVALAKAELPKFRKTPTEANLAGSGLDCALSLPENAPGRADAIAHFEAASRKVLADTGLAIAADDRAGLYGLVHAAREDAKDAAGAQTVAVAWIAYLDGVAAKVKSPSERTALDPNRLSAFLAAGEPDRAIPMLEQSQKDFPGDYNPPARLAFVYEELKRYDEALAASDRALELVYGPRRIRVLLVRADIHAGRGDAAAARRTLEEALRYAEALPPGQRSDDQIASLKKRLAPSDVAAQ